MLEERKFRVIKEKDVDFFSRTGLDIALLKVFTSDGFWQFTEHTSIHGYQSLEESSRKTNVRHLLLDGARFSENGLIVLADMVCYLDIRWTIWFADDFSLLSGRFAFTI